MSFKPLYIVQEWSARCFADCESCFRNFVDGPFDGDMTREIFEAANVGIPPGTMILPQFHGDSMNHKDFEYFMKRMKELQLRVSIPVSGFVGKKYISLLVEEGTPCYVYIVSMDGLSYHSYSTRRGKIPLDQASSFVNEALDKRGPRKTPWIAVRWVEGGQSEIEFEEFVKHWLFDVGVDFVLRSRLFNYGTKYNSPVSVALPQVCRSLVDGNPVVLFNGDVLLCERVNDRSKYIIGNVLHDTWPEIMDRRKALVSGYPNNDPCALCSAAYVLTGMKGIMRFRHGDDRPVFIHSDHSQTFYSLNENWSGINWDLDDNGGIL
ncbi:MAG: hypothetical protein WC344_05215 [Bacilli bacterium]|jgi:hypothetical protein